MGKWMAAVLAAGKGTRMKSRHPKVLHRVGGVPMVERVLAAADKAGVTEAAVIVGFGADEVQAALGDRVTYVLQAEQLGTGHALQLARDALAPADSVLVVCGDTPLLRAETLRELVATHAAEGAVATVLTTRLTDPTGYGRIVRGEDGRVVRIVEEKDADDATKRITEVNTGTYCFRAAALWEQLARIGCDNAQGEYYLTDVIGLLVDAGAPVAGVVCADAQETLGVNSRAQLAVAEQVARERKLAALMADGVTIVNPQTTYVDETVAVGADTVLEPGTILRGTTVVGRDCVIGPATELADTTVADGAHIHRTYAHECRIGTCAEIGPYVHLRPGTVLADRVKVGNFVEVKNSVVGDGSKLPHLSYIGDTDMGAHVNIGCGTITVNYNGKIKQRTTVCDGAFVGCNSNLVAPVTIGAQAYIGAGSTVTKDVPARALAVGRAKTLVKEHWVTDDTYKK